MQEINKESMENEKNFKIACGWCGVTMKEGSEEVVSHGICVDCEKVENRKADALLIADGSHKLCLNCGNAFKKDSNAQYCRSECETAHHW